MEGDIKPVKMSPFLLDRLYHWADDTDGAPDIELISTTDRAFIAKQGERVRGFKEDDMPEIRMGEFLDSNRQTWGPGWPD